MASPVLERLAKFNAWIAYIKGMVAIWFIRLFWPIPLIWGAIDWLVRANGGIGGLDYAPTEDDVAIRTFAGVSLFFVWLFLARRRGPFTLNRNGVLEVPPHKQVPAPPPQNEPYARKPAGY